MNTANENPSTTGRPVYRRPWFITLVILSLLFLVLLLLLPVGIGYGLKSWMQQQGAEQVEIEDVDFNPFSGTLAVRGLTVAAGGKDTLQLPSLAVVMDWLPLWRKQAYVRSIELQGLRLSVTDDAEEGLRIGGIRLPGGSEADAADKPDTESEPWGFGIGRLLISDSELGYQDARLETRAVVQELVLSELISWQPDQAADLTLAGAVDQAPLQITGKLTPFAASPGFDGKLQLEQLVLKTFSGLVRDQLSQLEGQLSIDSDLQAQQQDGALRLRQQGKVGLQGLQLAGEPLQLKQQQLGWDGKLELAIPSADPLTLVLDGRLEQGPMALRLAAQGLQVRDQGFLWQGGVNLEQQAESYRLSLKGQFEHRALDLALADQAMAVKNGRLNWSGELSVDGQPQTTRIQNDGDLKLSQLSLDVDGGRQSVAAERIEISSSPLQFQQQGAGAVELSHKGGLSMAGFELAQGKESLSEQGVQWQGDIALSTSADGLRLDSEGSLQTSALAALLPRRDLALKQGPLEWKGAISYGQGGEKALHLQARGDFTAGALLVDAPEHDVQLLAFDRLQLDGLDLKGPTALELKQVSTEGLRIARSEDAVALGEEGPPALLRTSRSSLTGIRFGSESGLQIDDLEHQDLKGIIRRDKDGGLNAVRIIDILTEILAGEAKPSDDGTAAAAPAEEPAAPAPGTTAEAGLPVRVNRVVVSGQSTLLYADDNVDPPYLARLDFTELELTDIDSGNPEQDSPFVLKAKIGEHAMLNLNGKARFFDKQGTADIKGRIEALELPPLSSYAGPAIGYRLKSGQMDADIDIQILQGKISGSNQLAIHQLEVAKLDAEQLKRYEIQSTPPLDTGLDMLRDRNNTIKLELPISGDISKPEFNVNDALNQAIGKAMQKGARVYLAAALFPFGTMLAVAEIAGEAAMQVRLDPVVFAAASTELDKTAKEYLAKVAKVMKERPAIHVKICGVVVDADRTALTEQVKGEAEAKAAAGGEAKQQGGAPAAGEQAKQGEAVESAGSAKPPPIIGSSQLKALAAERAATVKGYLIQQDGVKASRLVACDPEIELEKAASKPRVDLLL